jgi:uncharacterized protein YjiS (DUF1127 family)
MDLFGDISRRKARRNRMQAYLRVRDELNALSEADLADMGIKRYQLGHVARTRALG